MSTQFNLPLEEYADRTGQALLLVEPRSGGVVLASAGARDLFSLDVRSSPQNIFDLTGSGDSLAGMLRMALASSDPVTFGLQLQEGAQAVTVKANRYDHGQTSPLILMSIDAQPELTVRFRKLNEQILALNAEVERRRAAENTLAANMAALRRSLDVVSRLAEINTSGDDYLAQAAEVLAAIFGASGAVLVLRTASFFKCVAAAGSLAGAFTRDQQLDLATQGLMAHWNERPRQRDAILLEAVGNASVQPLDPAEALLIPFSVLGEPKGALVCFRNTKGAASEVSEVEVGIVAEAIGSLITRADFEARLIHGQRLEAIGRLTGGIAHDFNNILTVVLGNAELILNGVESADTRLARAIHDAAQRGATLTSHLLAFARKQPLRPETTHINELLRTVDPMIRGTLGAEVDLETVTAGGLWQTNVDRNQLETALLNLVVNARDAMPRGGKLTIETSNAHLDADYAEAHQDVVRGQYVMIAVTDTGTGMDASTAEQAFNPFFTTKEVGKGSGLGLSMVFGFVKQSEGHLKIYTEPGNGTTVRMYLPRYRGQAADTSDDNITEIAPELTNRGRILLVEDDPAVLSYTQQLLGILGYTVEAALNGAEAITKLDEETYDLVLTDVILPGHINGRMVGEHARHVAPDTAVLFMSGYTENAIVHDGRVDPDAELLSKPFTRNQLAKKLKELLEA